MTVPVGRSLLGAAAGIAGVTVLARAAGFGRTAVFAQTVGLECLGSTYLAVNAVPNVVFEVVAGGALASLVVPVLAPALAAGAFEQVSRTVSSLVTWTLLVLLPVTALGMLLAPTLVRLLLGAEPACGPAAQQVGTDLLRVFLPQVPLYGLAVVLTGVLTAYHRFVVPALAPLVSSLVVVIAYLVYAARGRPPLDQLDRGSELVLSIGTTLGVLALALTVALRLGGTGLRLRLSLRFPTGVAGQVRALAGAGIAGLLAQQVALVVALRLSAGDRQGPAVFTVALTLFLVPWAVLAVPVATSAYPRLASAAADDYALLTGRVVRVVLALTAVGAAGLFAVAPPLARLFDDGPALSGAVRAFAPGLVGYGLVALLTRAAYARGDGRGAATANVLGWSGVVLADLLLVGLTDLPRATSLGLGNAVGMTLSALLLLRALREAAPPALSGLARTAAVCLGAGAVLGVLSLAAPSVTSVVASLALSLVLVVVVGGAYAVAVRLLDPRAFAEVVRRD